MTTNIEEVEKWADVMNEAMECYDAEHDTDVGLPDHPTIEQLRSALEVTRTQTNIALMAVVEELKTTRKELDKLRNHRHDNSKQFGGRPEF